MKFFALTGLFIFVFSCSTNHTFELENGDLLFVESANGNLSEAIDEVTQTADATHFSHIALIEKSGDSIWVLHAAPQNGSERISLDAFKEYAQKDSSQIVVYRIKNKYKPDFKNAISEAKKMSDKPYNFTYILSDTAFYCSDFVYNAFVKDSIFTMEPMTFKDPKTNQFHATWIEFYKKQNLEIPEGKPGCNPNGMAASKKLEKIGRLNLN